jgi:hypothetical protein
MSAVILLATTLALLTGWASHYSPGKFQEVIANRQRWGHIQDIPEDVTCFAAGRYPDEIGELVWLRPQGEVHWTKCLVVDCAGRSDRRESDGLSGLQWMLASNVIYEVDAQTMLRWQGRLGRGLRIEVSKWGPLPKRWR